jgi:hypothetical protein
MIYVITSGEEYSEIEVVMRGPENVDICKIWRKLKKTIEKCIGKKPKPGISVKKITELETWQHKRKKFLSQEGTEVDLLIKILIQEHGFTKLECEEVNIEDMWYS